MRVAGEFTWDRAAPASLVDIDLSVPAGALVAVVGQTGSGKSSLLSAALNLMQQLHGPDVVVRGKVRMHSYHLSQKAASCKFCLAISFSWNMHLPANHKVCQTAGGLLPDQVTV